MSDESQSSKKSPTPLGIHHTFRRHDSDGRSQSPTSVFIARDWLPWLGVSIYITIYVVAIAADIGLLGLPK
jgi:hypothetical protein